MCTLPHLLLFAAAVRRKRWKELVCNIDKVHQAMQTFRLRSTGVLGLHERFNLSSVCVHLEEPALEWDSSCIIICLLLLFTLLFSLLLCVVHVSAWGCFTWIYDLGHRRVI